MQTYLFTLRTPLGQMSRHAGQQRDIQFTGTRDDLFTYIRWKSRTHEKVIEIRIQDGHEWVRDNGK
jgi:hypothetical protein